MAVYAAECWFAVFNCGTCISWSDSLFGHFIYGSAILCKSMCAHDNLLLAVSSVNYFMMIISIANLF